MISIDGVEIDFEEFPNGETRLLNLRQRYHDSVTFRYENDGDLLKLMLVSRHLENPDFLFIDYMPYSRMDRVKSEDQVFTLKYVADFINSLGFKHVEIVEPHSDVTLALVDRSEPVWVVPSLVTGLMQHLHFGENDYVVYPDAGAAKRYSISGVKTLFGHKVRDFDNGEITHFDLVGELPILPGLTKPRAIIADDLCSYGNTFIATAKALRQVGFEEIHLVVAHAEPAMLEGKLFDHVDSVVCTDSMWSFMPEHERLNMVKLEDFL